MISNNNSAEDPCFHLFETDFGPHMLLINGSQIFEVDEALNNTLSNLIKENDSQGLEQVLKKEGLLTKTLIDDKAPIDLPIHAFSLSVAQRCNLGCTYCYAQEGDFGGPKKNMEIATALNTVDHLFSNVKSGERANLTFLGGEPLINRQLVQSVTKYAHSLATQKGIHLGFSITTNGTLLTPQDADFFEEFGFAVTVSIDGIGQINDNLRSYKGGRGSYQDVIDRVKPLLAKQHKMQVSSRVTVTPQNLNLKETLDELILLGFHSVGFSPMLSSPTGRNEMGADSLSVMLEQMIQCGESFIENTIVGKRYPFSNMATSMRELHKGTHRPYPCSAGAGYLGVSADGGFFACHRFVNDNKAGMGNVFDGVDMEKRSLWLKKRHVHFQEPCNSCWAHYLCGGGCHYEVINRGRSSCSYIKGWLEFNLKAYVHLLERAPQYFAQ